MNIISRKEKKYLISLDQNANYSHNISQILAPDSHNESNGYAIRSLYFDTLNDRDYEDKEAGIELRRKIRLRLYNPKDNFAMLELKQKQGEYQVKRSIKLSKEDACSLINGQYNVLLKYNDKFALECYGIMSIYCYRPKTIVEYKRKAFIAKENNIRITFDSNIVATESNFNIFENNLTMYPVLDISNVVMEVKYNGFLLSYIKDALNLCDKNELSVSKYMLARSIGKKG